MRNVRPLRGNAASLLWFWTPFSLNDSSPFQNGSLTAAATRGEAERRLAIDHFQVGLAAQSRPMAEHETVLQILIRLGSVCIVNHNLRCRCDVDQALARENFTSFFASSSAIAR